MGYTITWDELEKICRKLNMERQGKTSVWKGTRSDGRMYLLRNQSGGRHLLKGILKTFLQKGSG